MSAPLTDSITRTVRPGCEAAFETALRELVGQSLQEAGQLGVSVLRPAFGSGSREYHILRRFESEATRAAFYDSPLFAKWLEQIAPLIEGESREETASGLEGWFTLPGEKRVLAPPKWKMAVVSVLGVHPTFLFWVWVLAPPLASWSRLLRELTITIAIVTSLTWLVMPLVTFIRPMVARRRRAIAEKEKLC